MAGRQRSHRGYDDRRGYAPEGPPLRDPLPRPQQHPVFLEEELEAQNAELRRLFEDNRRLAEDRAVLRRELNAAKDEVHHMNGVISNIRADQETQLRELYEKGKKLEGDVRTAEPLKSEATQLRAEVQKLSGAKQEYGRQIKSLGAEREKLQAENQQMPRMRSELDELKKEFMRVRMALDYEKKASFELMEQRQGMEKNMISMSQEAEKLRVELAGSDPRPWAAAGQYGMAFDGVDAAFPSHFSIGYGSHIVSKITLQTMHP
uniref:Protein FLX-like 3 n=1 Tax=Kalanchoe fedtschenkoi TaxID=63787 RepID=A0A7N0RI67_KALFE